jgi:hypothetical protein
MLAGISVPGQGARPSAIARKEPAQALTRLCGYASHSVASGRGTTAPYDRHITDPRRCGRTLTARVCFPTGSVLRDCQQIS